MAFCQGSYGLGASVCSKLPFLQSQRKLGYHSEKVREENSVLKESLENQEGLQNSKSG